MTYILMAALGIGFLIFIHELGHYLCARMAGVRVEVFSLGFGQRLFGFVRNGCDYRISLVPLGGYVRVAGEDPTRREHLQPDDLYATGYLSRFWFFSGGVLMNLLFALIVFPLVFQSGVQFTAPVAGAVIRGGPAWEAGIEAGDRIRTVDGKEMYDFDNMTVEVALLGDNPTPFEIERNGESLTVIVRPRYDEDRGIYEIGLQRANDPNPIKIRNLDPDSPAFAAGMRDGDLIRTINGQDAVGGDAAIEALATVWPDGPEPVTVEVDRAGDTQAFTFLPASSPPSAPRIGVTAAQRLVIGIRPGVPVLERLGIARGDVLLKIGDEPFDGADLASSLPTPATLAGKLVVTVQRNGSEESLETAFEDQDRKDLIENLAFGSSDVGSGGAERDGGVRVQPLEDSAAAKAGIRAGDQVLAVGGTKIQDWPDLIEAVQAGGDQPMEFTLQALGATDTHKITVTAERVVRPDYGYEQRLGLLRETFRKESIGDAIGAGFTSSVDLVKQLYVTLKRIFTGQVAAKNLGGIVTISRASYHFAEQGWAVFFYFLALLSINLAFVNVLPIPVLDGGHLLFLLIEAVKGSPVSAKVLTYSQILGLVFVIALMLFVTYNDILRLL